MKQKSLNNKIEGSTTVPIDLFSIQNLDFSIKNILKNNKLFLRIIVHPIELFSKQSLTFLKRLVISFGIISDFMTRFFTFKS